MKLAAIICLALPAYAQLTGFSKQELIKYTPLNPYGRLEDGRPNVPDATLKSLNKTSTTEIWGFLVRSAGYRSQFTGGWQLTQPSKRIAGRAFTAQYMPIRPEMFDIVEREAAERGSKGVNSNQRVIDLLQPGDVLVVDSYGKLIDGPWIGDNLALAIATFSRNGVIINGSIRDLPAIRETGIPVFHRGAHPTVFIGHMMLTGVNVPVRIDDVTVMPGDIVIADEEGVTFIPPHLAGKLGDYSLGQRIKDEWVQMKLRSGSVRSADVYPLPTSPELKKEYDDFAKRRKAELTAK